ncbi:MAG: tRNA epoxyqueuosine(34) reductase QueG [Myxococcales bacterium]|nr:tRNA epoxyqueuosine(34) reductase QueG [Myxococcales bacterium]
MVPPSDRANLDLTRDLKARAMALGFQRVGVAHAEGLEREARHLRAWVAQGFHASMDYMARTVDVRADPTHTGMLKEARSVVVVVASFASDEGSMKPGPLKIARYARRRDYHKVLQKRLKTLARWFSQQGYPTRSSVDRLPVLERAWAQRAGVGFVGKNCCLIVPGLGSHVFLAALITAALLEPDLPMKERCGTCTACLDGCPTRAFVAPRTLDARRCISYLTIEHKGAIAEELRPGMGEWMFGCDVCQDVCPYNHGKLPKDSPIEELRHSDRHSALRAADFLTQGPDELEPLLQGSPLRRAGFEGLARNAAITLANSGNRRHLRILEDASTTHASWVVRDAARWGAEQLCRK